MPGLLDRELNAEEQAVLDTLQAVPPRRREQLGAVSRSIRQLAASTPELLCSAALSLLGPETDPRTRAWLCGQLMECPEFLVQLTRPDRFSREQAREVCRKLMEIDGHLDVRLARLTPGRQPEGCPLTAAQVVRVLDILDGISPGDRLVLLLSHLTSHPHPRIAAKATVLIGRRLRNPSWTSRHLDSINHRVRASALEGLWTAPTRAARSCFLMSLNDQNNRVVGNALIGLHQLGEPAVAEFVKRMMVDPRPPFRRTAAWVMGQIGSEEFIELLERALLDSEVQVRQAADQALIAILRASSAAARQTAEC